MVKTLFIIMGLLLMSLTVHAQGTGGTGGGEYVMHKQNLHQYIVQEAYKVLEQAAPHQAAKLREHIGTMSIPSAPWEDKSISAGSYREDEEDILFSYGNAYDLSFDPDIDITKPGSCIGEVYLGIETEARQQMRQGMITTTHFWDPAASDNYLRNWYSILGLGNLDCLMNGPNPPVPIMLTIKPMYNAWEKASRFLTPNLQTPIRDIWVHAGEKFWYEDGGGWHYIEVPDPKNPADPLYLSYTTLMDLYNTGQCRIGWLNSPSSTVFTLTADQRNAYVWEILGRISHLLTDMSVPAHVHKDIHVNNQRNESYVFLLGTIILDILDADSYEQWIAHAGGGQDGDLSNIHWDADLVLSTWPNEPYIDPSSQQDPLYYLMNEMRSRTAAFASDDCDGTGSVDPNQTTDFPILHDETQDPTNQTQLAMLTTIRDATIPYCIRAVAGLLYWFANQITMPQQDFMVLNSGAEPPATFFYRPSQNDPYVQRTSPAPFSKLVGDDMFLGSYYELITGQTQVSKFYSWSSNKHDPTTQHQRDFIVMENNGNFEAFYDEAETNDYPNIAVWFEGAAVNPNSEIMFKNPWFVDLSQSDTNPYAVAQNDQFQPYATSPYAQGIFEESSMNNGGLFLGAGDPFGLLPPYYAIGLPMIYGNQMTPQTSYMRGDWLLDGLWRDDNAQLLDDPLGSANGLDPALYLSRAVIFDDPDAWVWANYKGHLLSSVPSNGSVSGCAICPNSQRKLDWIDNQSGFNNPQRGIDQMVYESIGSVWYTHSVDHGATWRKELGIAGGERPAIVSGWDAPYIVYYDNMKVHFGKVVNDSWWEHIAEFSCSDAATPVIARDDQLGIVVFAWEAHDGTIQYCARDDNGSFQVTPDVHSTNPTYPAVLPTIAHKYGSDAYHLAWREGPSIYYQRIEVGTNSSWPPEYISNGGQPAQGAPNITIDDNDYAAVSWTATQQDIPKTFINFRQNSPGGWGGFASILLDPANDYWAPSISNVSGTQPVPALRIAHNINSFNIGVMQLVNGNWTVPSLPQPAAEGLHPSLVDAAQSPNQLEAFSVPWYPYAGSLWSLWFTDEHLSKSTRQNVSLASSREVILSKDTNRVVYRVGEFIVNTGNVQDTLDWSSGMDSLIVGVNKPVHRYIETTAVTVPSNSHLRFRTVSDRKGTMTTVIPIVFTLEIVDAATDSVLASPHSIAANAMGNGHHDANINIPLQQFSGRDVVFRFRLDGRDTSVGLLTNNYYYLPDRSIPKAETGAGMKTAIAERASLDGNYPNPFNPNTEISYHLQEDLNIRLVICDALGREIAVLREGRENAGSHIETFDCRQCESGVYVCKLETPYGTLSRKMVLMK